MKKPPRKRRGFLVVIHSGLEPETCLGSSETALSGNVKKKAPSQSDKAWSSDPDRIRTCDLLLRRQLLYPAELLDHVAKERFLPTSLPDEDTLLRRQPLYPPDSYRES